MRQTPTAAEIEALLRQVARADLAGTPLYLAMASELPAELGGVCRAVFGYTRPTLGDFLRDHLGPRWQGRGPAMVIGDTLIGRHYPEPMKADKLLGVAAHELAHVVDQALPFDVIEPAESFVRYAGAVVVADQEQDHEEKVLADTAGILSTVFMTHPPRWLRCALHLRYRLEQLGHYLSAFQVIGQMTLIRPHAYQACLDGEEARLAHLPIRAALDLPLPPRFANLWQEDRAAFLEIVPDLAEREAKLARSHEGYKHLASTWGKS